MRTSDERTIWEEFPSTKVVQPEGSAVDVDSAGNL